MKILDSTRNLKLRYKNGAYLEQQGLQTMMMKFSKERENQKF